MDNLRADLRPELKKSATLKRLKREKEEIKSAAASAVQCRKIKTRLTSQNIKPKPDTTVGRNGRNGRKRL